MSRSLIRSGLAALFVLSLSLPAHALPLSDEREGFTVSLSALWERLVSPIVALWTSDTRSICDPNGGGCTNNGTNTDTRSICDPNGGGCGS
jgi:hypothetical protein